MHLLLAGILANTVKSHSIGKAEILTQGDSLVQHYDPLLSLPAMATTTLHSLDLVAAEVGVPETIALTSTQPRPGWVHTKAGRWFAGQAPAWKKGQAPPHILLATDLDCTLTMDDCMLARHAVEVRDAVDAGTAGFNRRWISMTKKHNNCVLCYSTGRSMKVFEDLILEQRARTDKVLPDSTLLLPDVLITSDGTSIHWLEDNGTLSPDTEWEAMLKTGWDMEQVRQIFMENPEVAKYGVDLQVWFNRLEDFRVSVVLEGYEGTRIAEKSVRRAIETSDAEIEAHVFICTHISGGSQGSTQYWLVATSKTGGKGQALDYVRKRIGADSSRVLVAGDSGNDTPMFDRAARQGVRGVIVGNAKPELVNFAKQFEGHIFAKQYCAEAITFALDTFDF